MIIVRLMGGMGNQFFAYAYARQLAETNSTVVVMDNSFLEADIPGVVKRKNELNNYDITAITLDTDKSTHPYMYKQRGFVEKCVLKMHRAFHGNYITQPHSHHYKPEYLTVGNNVYLDGYWQSYKFFEGIKGKIAQELKLKHIPLHYIVRLGREIASQESVCVNVRRKDFVDNNFHCVMGADYYARAARQIEVRVKNPKYFIFSDDVEWCKWNLQFLDGVIVEHVYAGDGFKDYHYLMQKCRHFIIPNSTFGWWAAWLSENENKVVVAPEKWYKTYNFDIHDLCPREWIII